jgi:hypothetical protein
MPKKFRDPTDGKEIERMARTRSDTRKRLDVGMKYFLATTKFPGAHSLLDKLN